MNAYGEMAFGGLVNAGAGVISNFLAKWREEEARRENYKYGEMAADAADARTRALYNDLQSPYALLQQYKAAGLSPAAMYAGSGGGAVPQGAQSNGAAGVSPTTYGINPMEGAQVALLEAQTRKLNAESDTIEGKNERGQNEIAQILAQAGLQNAEKLYTEAETKISKINGDILDEAKEWKAEQFRADAQLAMQEAEKALYEARQAKLDFDFNKETYKTRVNEEEEKLKKLAAEVLFIKQGQQLTYWQEKKLSAEINKIWWDALYKCSQLEWDVNKFQMEYEIDIQKFVTEMGLEYDKLDYDARKTVFQGFTDILKGMAAAATLGAVKMPTKTTPKTTKKK